MPPRKTAAAAAAAAAATSAPVAISLCVPADFDLPSFYRTSDPSQNAEALRMGARTLEYVTSQRTSTETQMLQANHAAELHRIQQEAMDTIARLETQHEEQAAKSEQERQQLRAKHANLQTVLDTQTQLAEQQQEALKHQQEALKQDHKRQQAVMSDAQALQEQLARQDEKQRIQSQMDTIVRQLKEDLATREASNAALKERIHQIQTDRDRDIESAEHSGRRAIQALLDEKQASIERLEREKDRITGLLEAKVQALHADTQQLGDLIRRKPAVASVKGKEFEEQMENQLHNAFSVCDGYALVRTANNGRGHEADFLMNMKEQTILWECKNYDNNVPAKEVQKLYRDVHENPAVSVAVMISKFTPIVGHTSSGDFDIEFINDVMYVYISRYEYKSEDVLKSLMFLFRLFWQYRRTIQVDESKQKVMRVIMELHTRAVKVKSDWRKHKSGMDATVKWMGDTIDESEEALRKAVQTLEGSTEIDIPEGIFNDAKNEAESQLIQRVLKYVILNPDESVDLSELAKVIAQDRNCTEATAKTHLKSILSESLMETRSGRPTRVKGMLLVPIPDPSS